MEANCISSVPSFERLCSILDKSVINSHNCILSNSKLKINLSIRLIKSINDKP